MASAAALALTTSVVTVFSSDNDGGHAREYYIKNSVASAGTAFVNVAGLHKAGEYIPLEPGDQIVVARIHAGIDTITANAASTATINHGVLSR